MKKRILCAALCSIALCAQLCGCGDSRNGLTLIGTAAEECIAPDAGGTRSGESAEAAEKESEADGETAEIYVYVCGAVKNPGVVALPEGSRGYAALEAAGGFNEDAKTDYVNLAARLSDGEKLYFPTAEEINDFQQEEAEGGLIDINTADAATLCTLPGIGESRAADIINYRENQGRFETCEDIMKVPGIKTSVYQKICDKITVR